MRYIPHLRSRSLLIHERIRERDNAFCLAKPHPARLDDRVEQNRTGLTGSLHFVEVDHRRRKRHANRTPILLTAGLSEFTSIGSDHYSGTFRLGLGASQGYRRDVDECRRESGSSTLNCEVRFHGVGDNCGCCSSWTRLRSSSARSA